jgi:TPR repeat protein
LSDAPSCFQLSADQGDQSGQFDSSQCLFEGKGASFDFSNAAHYSKLSADQEDGSGQFYYGHCLH